MLVHLISLLFSPAILAVPYAAGAGVSHRHSLASASNTQWAGINVELKRGGFSSVSATVSVPEAIQEGLAESAFSTFLAIDASSECPNSVAVGYFVTFDDSGSNPTIGPFYEVSYSTVSVGIEGITVDPGDKLNINITPKISRTSATVDIKNLTKKQSASLDINIPGSLCLENASWMTGTWGPHRLADFDTVQFEDVMATTSSGKLYQEDPNVATMELVQDGRDVTVVKVVGDTIVINHL